MKPHLALLVVLLGIGVLTLIAPAASAQGVQTGIISGVVADPEGLPVPGASVTVTSPALQGARTTVTDEIGAYIIRGLPPGTYTVRFELAGAKPVEQEVDVPLGGVAKLDPTFRLAALQEAVTVTANVTPAPLAVTQTSTNISADQVNVLPIGRRPFEIAVRCRSFS